MIRVGMSWPVGRGRRQWISMPIWCVPIVAAIWLAGWLLAGVFFYLPAGIVAGVRKMRKRS